VTTEKGRGGKDTIERDKGNWQHAEADSSPLGRENYLSLMERKI